MGRISAADIEARERSQRRQKQIEDCRRVLLEEMTTATTPRRSINAATLLASLEAEQARDDKADSDALRDKECEASLQASSQWREEQVITLRADISAELRAAQTLQVFEDKQALTRLAADLSGAREQNRLLQATNTEQQTELISLRTRIAQSAEYISTLLKDNSTLMEQVTPVDPAILQQQLDELDKRPPADISEDELLRHKTRVNRQQLLLLQQLNRIAKGEKILQFQADIEAGAL